MTFSGSAVLRAVPWLRYRQQGYAVTVATVDKMLRYEGRAATLLLDVLRRIDGRTTIDAIGAELGLSRLARSITTLCQRLVEDGLAIVVDPEKPTLLENELLLAPDARSFGEAATHSWLVDVVGTDDEVEAVSRVAPPGWTVRDATLSQEETSHAVPASCTIVWVADVNDPTLVEWNVAAYEQRRRWLPISHFDGQVAVIGPYIEPPQTPCFECYRRRRASRSSLAEDYLDFRPVTPFRLTTESFTHVLAGIAAVTAQQWAEQRNPHIPGAVQTVTIAQGMSVNTEYVLRVPRCCACRPIAASGRPALWSEYFDLDRDY